jgi:hypothetical protein
VFQAFIFPGQQCSFNSLSHPLLSSMLSIPHLTSLLQTLPQISRKLLPGLNCQNLEQRRNYRPIFPFVGFPFISPEGVRATSLITDPRERNHNNERIIADSTLGGNPFEPSPVSTGELSVALALDRNFRRISPWYS